MKRRDMKGTKQRWLLLLIFAVGLGCASVSWAVQANTSVPMVPVSVIVSVEAKHGTEVPTIYKEDVRVFHDHNRFPVVDWVPYEGDHAGLELFLLIDDSSSSDLGLQLDDLRKFINGQPATTSIAVGYIRNGGVDIIQNFTQDRSLTAKALRLPMGAGGESSPYTAISDLVQRWPESARRREIFLVSSGIDALQPGPNDSYLDEAIERAQRTGIQVYSIYATRAGHLGHTLWRSNWGQNNLSRLADETGGEAYFQALQMPISYGPYLDAFADRLKHQFRLTFLAKARKDAGLQKIRLDTEVPNAELVTSDSVYVPAAK
jgi:hypothetical protein